MSNRIFYFLGILLLLSFSCANEQLLEVEMKELSIRKNDNGESLRYYNNKLFTGTAIHYHSNGNKYIEQTFQDGIKEGQWLIYFEDGSLHKLGFVSNGVEDNIYREWYPNGQLRYEYHYIKGKRTGRWDTWYDSGIKWTERDFKNGLLDGKVKVYDTDGTLTKDYTYSKGELIGQELLGREKK